VTLLPFPQEQLSTDDFDGPLYNATNLAVKGVAAIAAYGYIVEKARGRGEGEGRAPPLTLPFLPISPFPPPPSQYTGNVTAAEEAYAVAALYSETLVQVRRIDDGDGEEASSSPFSPPCCCCRCSTRGWTTRPTLPSRTS